MKVSDREYLQFTLQRSDRVSAMNRKLYKNLPGLVLMTFTLGCERKTQTSKVRIDLPSLSTGASMSVPLKVVKANSGGGWGLPLPTTNSDIKCFAVFVSTGDAALDNKSCIKGEGASFLKFGFSTFKGFAPAGGSLEFELDSGSGRTFYIMGVNSSISTCQDFSTPEALDQSVMSNPVLVGSQTANLVPGDNSLVIPVSVGADPNTQAIQNCSFFPGGGVPNRIDVHGGISTFDNGNLSRIGIGTCNRIRVYAKSDSGDAILENDLSVNVNIQGSIGSFFSAADCLGAVATSATIPKGGKYTDLYFLGSGTPATTGTVGFSYSYNGQSVSTQKPVQIAAQGSLTQIRFFDDSVTMGANSCSEIPYFGVDTSGQTADIGSGRAISVFDLVGGNQSGSIGSLLPGFSLKSSCSGSAVTNFPYTSAHGQIALQMGANRYFDFQVGYTTNMALNVNLVPKASSLAFLSTPLDPYASECTEFYLRSENAVGAAADLSGNDSSPFSIVKQILGNMYVQSGPANMWATNTCTTAPSNSNFVLNNGAGTAPGFIRFTGTQAVSVRAWAGRFVVGEGETFLNFTPKWDPGLLPGDTMFLKAPGAGFSGVIAATASTWPGLGSFAVAGPITVSGGSLGTGNHVMSWASTQALMANFSGASDISYGMLVSFSNVASGTLAVMTNGTVGLATIEFDSPGVLKITTTDSGGAAEGISSTPVSINTWYSLVATRNVSLNVCKIYLNGAQVAIASPCDGSELASYFSFSPTYTTYVGELFITRSGISAADAVKFHQYLDQRYPSASLP